MPRIFRNETMLQIREWVLAGMSSKQIASRLGCKVSTLYTRCSESGISLRAVVPTVIIPPVTDSPATVAHLSTNAMLQLQMKAYENHTTVGDLIGNVLTRVAEDNLFKAVLDD